MAGAEQQPHCDGVAERGGPRDVLRGHAAVLVERGPKPLAATRQRGRLSVARQRGASGKGLEAADVPATADHRRVIDDLDVSDVARRALRAPVDSTVRDDPSTDAGADLDDDRAVVAHGDAGPPLAEGEDVDVVVDPDRGTVSVGQPLSDRVAVPTGHDRRRDGPPGAELHWPGDPDPDAPQPAGQVARRGGQLAEQLVDAGEAQLRPGGDVCGLVAVTQDPPVEVGDGDIDAGGPEVSDEEVARIGAKAHASWRSAPGARPRVALDHQAELDQLADPLRDDAAREAGPRDQLGTRA